MQAKAIVSSKGQIVIPQALRKKLHIHEGTELIFILLKSGRIEIKTVQRSISMCFGRGKELVKNDQSISNIDELIGQAVLANDHASKKA
jgi:AbrB family looped-hinge helix DNA binding protein